jgi:hypothetical protein
MNLLLLNHHVLRVNTYTIFLILSNKAIIPSIAAARKFVDHSKGEKATKMLAMFIDRFREVIEAYKTGLKTM